MIFSKTIAARSKADQAVAKRTTTRHSSWHQCLGALFTAAAFVGSSAAFAAEPIRLALSKTPLTLPFYLAASEGLFAAEGVNVAIEEVIGGHRSMKKLLDGDADLATSSDTVVMFSSFQRDDFSVVATFVSSADDVKIVAHPDSGIVDATKLGGKRVGTVWGAASHYYLDSLAILNGVDPKSIEVVRLQPEAMAAALADRSVDAVSIWQPFAYRIERELAGARVLADEEFYSLRFNLIASRQFVAQRDAELGRLLKALDRATELIASNPAKAKATLHERLQLDAAYIDWLWPRYRFRLGLDQALLTLLEGEARWAIAAGHVSATRIPNYLSYFQTKPLRGLRNSAVTIIE